MELNIRDLIDINNVLEDCSCIEGAIEVSVLKDNRELYDEPQVFKTRENFVEALQNLENYEFQRAINRQILFNKIGNQENTYHLQLRTHEVDFTTELDVE